MTTTLREAVATATGSSHEADVNGWLDTLETILSELPPEVLALPISDLLRMVRGDLE